MKTTSIATLLFLSSATQTDAFVPLSSKPMLMTQQIASTESTFANGGVHPQGAPLPPGVRRGSLSSTTLMMAANGNLFDRFFRVLRSNVNNALKAIEDPEKVIEQTVTDMQSDLLKIRQAYSEVTANNRRLMSQKNQAEAMANDWYNRAQLALQRGREDLAREALARRQQFLDQAENLQSQIDAMKTSMDRLYDGMKMLETKIQEAVAKKEQMIARARTAKNTQKVNDMLSGLTGKTSMDAFNRMEERVLALEAAAEVSEEMTKTAYLLPSSNGKKPKKSLEDEFRLLEQSDAVEQELQKMKGRLLEPSRVAAAATTESVREAVKVPVGFY